MPTTYDFPATKLPEFDFKQSVRAATTEALAANTRAGNTLTANANGVMPSVDSIALVVGERVLVKNEAAGANNGIYTVSSVGAAGAPWVLIRATDADQSNKVTSGLQVPINEGTTNADTQWQLTTNDVITLNTTALTFALAGNSGWTDSGATIAPTTSTDQVLVNGGSAAAPGLSWVGDTNTGFHSAADAIACDTAGVIRWVQTDTLFRLDTALNLNAAGSAAAAAFYLFGDNNTGLFRPAEDVLAVTTGGVERVRLDNSGVLATILRVDGAAANGQNVAVRTLTELHTLAAAVNSDTTITIPANALVLFVSARVTTSITGPANWRYGLASGDAAADRYGNSLALAAGTTNPGFDRSNLDASNTGPLRAHTTSRAIRLSAQDGVTAFTAGVVRVTIHYIDVTVPVS